MTSHRVTTVRPARVPDELPTVRRLLAEYAAGLAVDLSVQGFDREVASLPGRYARPAGNIWLGIDAGSAVGCVAMRPLDDDRCEIKRLYVRPDARGTGLGRRLAEAALAGAVDAGYRRVCLDTLPSMRGAIALYRALGFDDIEPYDEHALPGALFLERRL